MISEMEMYEIIVPTHKHMHFIFSSFKNLELIPLSYERNVTLYVQRIHIVTKYLLRLFSNNIPNNLSHSK